MRVLNNPIEGVLVDKIEPILLVVTGDKRANVAYLRDSRLLISRVLDYFCDLQILKRRIIVTHFLLVDIPQLKYVQLIFSLELHMIKQKQNLPAP